MKVYVVNYTLAIEHEAVLGDAWDAIGSAADYATPRFTSILSSLDDLEKIQLAVLEDYEELHVLTDTSPEETPLPELAWTLAEHETFSTGRERWVWELAPLAEPGAERPDPEATLVVLSEEVS